jgi:hypothetical protein
MSTLKNCIFAMYSLWSARTYNFINFNFLCRGAPVLKKTNSGMLFISSFCPPPYVTDTGTILFSLLSTSVCKTYVKKTNSRMLNFWDTSSLKFKYSASPILNLYIAETVGAICRTRKNKSVFFRSPVREPVIQKMPKSRSRFFKEN